MRIAIISPYSTGAMRGNITTVGRIARFLNEAGADTVVFPMDELPAGEIEQRLRAFSPDVVHAFHAYCCGETGRKLARQLNVPFVLTITGSDINERSLREHASTMTAIGAADAVVCFDDAEAAIAGRYRSGPDERPVLIPQGVETLPAGRFRDVPDDAFVLLLPAALRRVKNIEFPLQALAPLCGHIDRLLLVIAGGVIDHEYADSIREMLPGAPFARWIGEVPHESMGGLYARADLVLNCSRFEGMPNCLMEAMALARPVLAADIPGNRTLVRHGMTGWLYLNEDDFRNQVVRLARNQKLRDDVGANAREYVLATFPPNVEADRYIRLYNGLLHDAA